MHTFSVLLSVHWQLRHHLGPLTRGLPPRFAHALLGSEAIYKGWQADVDAVAGKGHIQVLPIALPGRLQRSGEPAFTHLRALAVAAADAINKQTKVCCVLQRVFAFRSPTPSSHGV